MGERERDKEKEEEKRNSSLAGLTPSPAPNFSHSVAVLFSSRFFRDACYAGYKTLEMFKLLKRRMALGFYASVSPLLDFLLCKFRPGRFSGSRSPLMGNGLLQEGILKRKKH